MFQLPRYQFDLHRFENLSVRCPPQGFCFVRIRVTWRTSWIPPWPWLNGSDLRPLSNGCTLSSRPKAIAVLLDIRAASDSVDTSACGPVCRRTKCPRSQIPLRRISSADLRHDNGCVDNFSRSLLPLAVFGKDILSAHSSLISQWTFCFTRPSTGSRTMVQNIYRVPSCWIRLCGWRSVLEDGIQSCPSCLRLHGRWGCHVGHGLCYLHVQSTFQRIAGTILVRAERLEIVNS